jgi:antitoxin component YwqK of YwqJK toxin-antitoxin module
VVTNQGRRISLQAGAFKNGKQVHFWKRYYDSGQLWDEGTYEDGKKIGEWKTYDSPARSSRKPLNGKMKGVFAAPGSKCVEF